MEKRKGKKNKSRTDISNINGGKETERRDFLVRAAGVSPALGLTDYARVLTDGDDDLARWLLKFIEMSLSCTVNQRMSGTVSMIGTIDSGKSMMMGLMNGLLDDCDEYSE